MSDPVIFQNTDGAQPEFPRADLGTGNVGRATQRVTLASDGFFPTLFNNIYTALTQSIRVEEIDPISQHYVAETLADVTDQADATYDYYVDMAGYTRGGFQIDLSWGLGTVTATCWMTLQDDGTAPAACAYQDVTNDLFGVVNLQAAAGAVADMWLDDAGAMASAKYVRIRIIAATGGAAAQLGDWTIYHKRLY
jgi:hypothetical protein